ncbi:MAG: OmpA family protein, partial [Acidimicrobiaceae bacterium]|nr:OmpA family protein [Acidimicrobiaceae bacterium]
RKWWHGRRAVAAIAGLAAVALIVAFAVSAVSGGGHPRRQPGQSAAAASPTSASAPSATSGSAGAGSPGRQLAGIRTFQFTPQGTDQLTVTVYDLRRHGPFLTLDFKAAGPPGSNGDLAFDFYEGEGTFGFNSLDGIRLLDPVHNKVYRAVQDSQQNDWQSQLDVSLEAATSELLWVTFPAPPRSVKRLDVLFSNGGPQLTGVPITTASAGPSASQVGTGVEVPPPATFAEPRGSTDTSGLTLPVNSLILTVGNKSGADAESATSATVTLNTDVLFDFDKSNLTPQASKILRATAAKVSRGATGGVTVDGYTDSIGTDAVNIPLSQARAQAVVTALQSLTPGVSYTSHGHGSADPVAPNTKPDGSDNPAGRALNRRVTITYNIKAPAPPAPPPAAAPAPASSGGATGSVTYHAASGSNYRVRVDHLYREGDLVVADFGAKCLASFGNSCNYQTDFSAQVPSEGSVDVPPVPADQNSVPGFDSSFAAADAVYLEDPNGSIYDPAHDDANVRGSQLVANTDTLQGSEGPKPFEPLWAYFPAPPANVKTMSFVLPGGTTRIANVPVEARSPRS